MSHLDEGTVHALLDGELGTTEVAEITAHLSGCAACAQRYREAKEFRAEADRLIESVELAESQAPRGPAAVVDTPAAPTPRAVEPPVVVERAMREPVREPVREPSAPRPPEPRRAEPPPTAAQPPRQDLPRVEPRPPESAPVESAPSVARSPEPPRAPRPPRPQPTPQAARPDPWNAPPPPLMIPDNESRAERRFLMMRRLGVAATILVVAGTAALAYKLRPGTPPVIPDDSLAAAARPTGVLSSLERTGVPSSGMQQPDTVPDVPAPSVPRSTADESQSPPTHPSAALGNSARAEAPARPKSAPVAKQQARAPQGEAVSAGAADSLAEALASDTGVSDSAPAQDLAEVRRRAAEATQLLDRDRRRDQAAAATAALDAARRRNAAAPPAAAPPPAPPTIEQRAGIYLRIGLDEASRQLGGPAHVIEGMSASFMGLAPGGVDPGADSTRPLVRVVYQDSQGRLILLDQQRLRAGQAPPQGPLAWVTGEIALWLRGEAPADALRVLRPRVR